MTDWTTKRISDDSEIDLHPDLDSFPAQIRSKLREESILLSKEEIVALYWILDMHLVENKIIGERWR